MTKQSNWNQNQEACAFPKVQPPLKPLKNLILVQYRNSRANKSINGLIRLDYAQKDRWENLIVKVIALGPLAFKTRNLETGKMLPFSEGDWVKEGDYVRIPNNGADYLFVKPSSDELKVMEASSLYAEKLDKVAEFKATEGLAEEKYIKFALLQDSDILAVVNSFDVVLNGH